MPTRRERWRGENNGGGGPGELDSASISKVEPTGLVKDYKMFSVRDQIVNMLSFAGLIGSVSTTWLCW